MASWGIVVACLVLVFVCLSSVSATIFPEEYYGYRHYAKKEMSQDCLRCASTYNYMPCLRCWQSKYAVIPFHSKRAAGEPAELGSDVMTRDRRYTGCSCCITSRFTNNYCCDVCNAATKRMGKRGSDVSMIEEPEKRMNPACLCCSGGNVDCCNECIRGYVPAY